jgi:hypothetical protein
VRKRIRYILGVTGALLVSMTMTTAVYADQPGFEDVNYTDWHVGYVLTLAEMDLVRGYEDSTFRPNDTISQAEFIVLAMKARHYEYEAATGEHWAMNYIRGAEAMGAIEAGMENREVLNSAINRGSAARILVRTNDIKTVSVEDAAFPFTDFDMIPAVYQPYVLTAYQEGWLSGYPDGTFRADHSITRAEASVILTKSLGSRAEETRQLMVAEAARLLEEEMNAADNLRESVLEVAYSLEGSPYRRGGSSPSGFDCSGYVSYVMAKHGIVLPRSTDAMFRAVDKIESDELAPGDLVFFTTYKTGPSHVGIYVGDNTFIHAPSSGKTVSYDRLDDAGYWQSRFIGAARVL